MSEQIKLTEMQQLSFKSQLLIMTWLMASTTGDKKINNELFDATKVHIEDVLDFLKRSGMKLDLEEKWD